MSRLTDRLDMTRPLNLKTNRAVQNHSLPLENIHCLNLTQMQIREKDKLETSRATDLLLTTAERMVNKW